MPIVEKPELPVPEARTQMTEKDGYVSPSLSCSSSRSS